MTAQAALGLPVFPHHFYGVQVSEIGEDADFVGHGHISPMRFIAACNRVARLNWGYRSLIQSLDGFGTGVADESYAELRGSVHHMWAVRHPKCNCPESIVHERGCEKDHDLDPDPEAWWLSSDGITADTPGAFPVTLGLWSW